MKIAIYGTPTCPRCDDIKRHLTQKGISFESFTIGDDIQVDELELIVSRRVKSAPVITKDGSEILFDVAMAL